MLEITINEGLGENVTEPVYQYDVGRTLKIRGMTFENPPPVHFANNINGNALIVASTLENNVISVNIPNTLLAESLPIFAYIYTIDGTTGQTVSVIRIPIIKRPKPEDWEPLADEDLIRYEHLDARLNKLIEDWTGAFDETQEALEELTTKVGSVTSGTVSLAMGMYASKTVFNSNGSITETGDGWSRVTTFNSDGSITEVYTSTDPDTGEVSTVTKTTVFNSDGSITATLVDNT